MRVAVISLPCCSSHGSNACVLLPRFMAEVSGPYCGCSVPEKCAIFLQASPAVGAEVGADSRVPDHSDGLGEGATAAVGRRERGAGIGRDIPKHKPARARQKGATRCSLM